VVAISGTEGRRGRKPVRRRMALVLRATAIAALIGLGVALSPLGRWLEQDVALGVLFAVRGPRAPPPDIVIVGADKDSARALGLSGAGPWPRRYYAALVNELAARGAALIVFDLAFTDAGDPDDDLLLAAAMASSARVVLAQPIERRAVAVGREGSAISLSVDRRLVPAGPLAAAAAAVAPFPLPRIADRINEFWTFKTGTAPVATIPAAVLQLLALDAYRKAWTPQTGLPAPPEAPGAAALERFMAETRRAVRAGAAEQLEALAGQPDLTERERHLLAALADLYAGPDHRFLNFYGPAGSFSTVPHHRLATSGPLSGKVVFFGAIDLAEARQYDHYRTAFARDDGIDMSGVEIAATAFANLSDRRGLRMPTLVEMLLCNAAFALAVGLFGAFGSAAFASLAVIGLAAAWAAGAVALFAANAVLPLGVPLLVEAPLLLFFALHRHWREERSAREGVDRAIRYYVPDEVARRVSTGGAVPWDASYGVCLATDVEGYSGVAEPLSPVEAARLTDEYFGPLFNAVHGRGGTVEVHGDGAMCVWKARTPGSELRRHACDAALEFVAAVGRFNVAHFGTPMRTRLGLHAGPVASGNVGTPGHFVYTVVGDVANTASRIEGLNKRLGTRILASEAALEGLSEFVTRPVGNFVLAGKSQAVRIHELVTRTGPRVDALLAGFDAALSTFESGDRAEAKRRFHALAAQFPKDGPTQFYLGLLGAEAADAEGVVRLLQK
jgi:adenylate cyclase